MKEIAPQIFTWSWLSPKHGYTFNGFVFKSREGLIVIDPPILESADRSELEAMGKPKHIILTNKDHVRKTSEMKEMYGAKVYIHEKDADDMQSAPDEKFKDGNILPGSLTAINISDNKSAGETAFLLPRKNGILFIGDAVIGWPPGEFSLLPKGKYKDPAKAHQSLKKLLKHDFETVLVGDGESILEKGKEAFTRFFHTNDVHLKLPVGQ